MAENRIQIKLAVDTSEAGKINYALDKQIESTEKISAKTKALNILAEQRAAIEERIAASTKKAEETLNSLSQKATAIGSGATITGSAAAVVSRLNTKILEEQTQLEAVNYAERLLKQRDFFGKKAKAALAAQAEERRQQQEAYRQLEAEAEAHLAKLNSLARQNNKTETSRARGNLYGLPATMRSEEDNQRIYENLFGGKSGFAAIVNRSIYKTGATFADLGKNIYKPASDAGIDMINKLTKFSKEQAKVNEEVVNSNKKVSDSHDLVRKSLANLIIQYRAINFVYNQFLNSLYNIPKVGIQLESTTASLTATFGNAASAGKELQFLTQEALRSGQSLTVLREQYANAAASFIAAGESAATTREIFQNVNTVATTLHLSGDRVSGVYLALSQIFNKTKLQAEELTKQLSQTIPGVTNQQAEALGITVSELYDKMKKGAISAHEAVLALSRTLGTTFGGDAFITASKGLNAEFGRLTTSWTLLTENFYKASEGVLKQTVKDLTSLTNALIGVTSDTYKAKQSFEGLVSVISALTVSGAVVALGAAFVKLAGAIAGASTAGTVFAGVLTLIQRHPLIAAGTALAGIATFAYTQKKAVDQATESLEEYNKQLDIYYGRAKANPEAQLTQSLAGNQEYQNVLNFKNQQEQLVKSLATKKVAGFVNKIEVSNVDSPEYKNAVTRLNQLKTKLIEVEIQTQQEITEKANNAIFDASEARAKFAIDAEEAMGNKITSAKLKYIKQNAKRVGQLQQQLDDATKVGDQKRVDEALKGLQDYQTALTNIKDPKAASNEARAAKEAFKIDMSEIAAAAEANKTILTSLLNDITLQYEENLVGITSYYKQKQALQEASFNSEQQGIKEQIALALSKGEAAKAAKLNVDLFVAESQASRELTKTTIELEKAKRELASSITQINSSYYSSIGMTIEALKQQQIEENKLIKVKLEAQLNDPNATASEKAAAKEAIINLELKQKFDLIDANASKAKELRDAMNDVTSSYKEMGATSSDVLNSSLGGFNSLFNVFENFSSTQEKVLNQLAELKAQAETIASKKTEINLSGKSAEEKIKSLQAIADLENLNRLSTQKADNELYKNRNKLARESLGVVTSMFKEGTKARKIAHVAEMAFNVAEKFGILAKLPVLGAQAMLTQGQGDPYSAFARIAAMAGLVASIISAVGGGSSTSTAAGFVEPAAGTGTVAGKDSEQSQSLQNSMDLLVSINYKSYGELRKLNANFLSLSSVIDTIILKGVNNSLIDSSFGDRQASALQAEAARKREQMASKAFQSFFGPTANLMPDLKFIATKDPFQKFLTNLIFGKITVTVKDTGVLIKQLSAGLLAFGREVDILQYTTLEVKKKSMLFGSSTKLVDVFQKVTPATKEIFNKLYRQMFLLTRTLVEAIDPKLYDNLLNYTFPKIKISLKKKDFDSQAKALQAAISAALDKVATSVFGAIFGDYRQIGEGMFQTINRLYTQSVVVEQFFKLTETKITLNRIELMKFSQSLIDLSSNASTATERFKEFSNQIETFYNNFASAEAKVIANLNSFAGTLADVFVTAVNGTELQSAFINLIKSSKSLNNAVYSIAKGFDITSENAAAAYAALLKISPEIPKIFTEIVDDVTKQITSLQDSIDPRTVEQLMAELANTTDLNRQRILVTRIKTLIMDKYNTEINSIKSIKTALISLKETVKGLLLGDLSTLDPRQKLEEAQKQYAELLNIVKGSDVQAAADAAGKLGNAAQNYLKEAKSYFGATETYATIFDSVVKTLDSLSTTVTDKDTAIVEATRDLANAAIEQLNLLVTNFTEVFATNLDNLVNQNKPTAQPPRELTTPEKLYQALNAALDTKTKADDRALQRQIKAYNKGGQGLYEIELQRQLDIATLAEKQKLFKAMPRGEDKQKLLEEINALKAKIKAATTTVGIKADGGMASGYTLVGERGPELLRLPNNTKVVNNTNTQRMLNSSAAQQTNLLSDIKKELSTLNTRMETIERKTRLTA